MIDMIANSLQRVNLNGIVNIYSWADESCSYNKGYVISETRSKWFTNHNAQDQLTNQSTFRISEGGVFETDWEERCCNNVTYVKNNMFWNKTL